MIHLYEEYLLVTRFMYIFALYKKNKHSIPRQKREKSGTGICHVIQGKESKTCPYDFRKHYSRQKPEPAESDFFSCKTFCNEVLFAKIRHFNRNMSGKCITHLLIRLICIGFGFFVLSLHSLCIEL